MNTETLELAETHHGDDQICMAKSNDQLRGKVVIVTGSVGNLGLATALALQEVGAKTVLVDRSNERLREKYPNIADSPDHLLAGGVDLVDRALVRLLS